MKKKVKCQIFLGVIFFLLIGQIISRPLQNNETQLFSEVKRQRPETAEYEGEWHSLTDLDLSSFDSSSMTRNAFPDDLAMNMEFDSELSMSNELPDKIIEENLSSEDWIKSPGSRAWSEMSYDGATEKMSLKSHHKAYGENNSPDSTLNSADGNFHTYTSVNNYNSVLTSTDQKVVSGSYSGSHTGAFVGDGIIDTYEEGKPYHYTSTWNQLEDSHFRYYGYNKNNNDKEVYYDNSAEFTQYFTFDDKVSNPEESKLRIRFKVDFEDNDEGKNFEIIYHYYDHYLNKYDSITLYNAQGDVDWISKSFGILKYHNNYKISIKAQTSESNGWDDCKLCVKIDYIYVTEYYYTPEYAYDSVDQRFDMFRPDVESWKVFTGANLYYRYKMNTADGVAFNLYLYDYKAGKWVSIDETSTTNWRRIGMGLAGKYMSSSGQVRARFYATRKGDFSLSIDELKVRYYWYATSDDDDKLLTTDFTKNLGDDFLNRYDTGFDEYQKRYNIKVQIAHEGFSIHRTAHEGHAHLIVGGKSMELSDSPDTQTIETVFDSSSTDSLEINISLQNGDLNINTISYTILFKCITTDNLRRLKQTIELNNTKFHDYSSREFKLEVDYALSEGSDTVDLIDENAHLLINYYIKADETWLKKTTHGRVDENSTSFDITSYMDYSEKTNFQDFRVEFILSGNLATLDVSRIELRSRIIYTDTTLASTAESPGPDSDGNFTLSWAEQPYPATYSLYRHTSKITEINSSLDLIDTFSTQYAYEFVNHLDGEYYYTVYVENIYDSFQTDNVFLSVGKIPLTFSINSSAEDPDLDGMFDLFWDPSIYADQYEIYYATAEFTEPSTADLLGTTTDLIFECNMDVGTYFLRVLSTNSYGSYLSNYVQVEIGGAPQDFKLEKTWINPDDDGNFSLQWNHSLYASNYSLYTSNKSITEINESSQLLDTVSAQGTDIVYEITDFIDGDHYFIIQAKNKYGETLSNEQFITVHKTPKSYALTSNSSCITDTETILLSWTHSRYSDNYSLYYSNETINDIDPLTKLRNNNLTNSSIIIKDLKEGYHYFMLVAKNKYGNLSSNCVEVIVSQETPIITYLSPTEFKFEDNNTLNFNIQSEYLDVYEFQCGEEMVKDEFNSFNDITFNISHLDLGFYDVFLKVNTTTGLTREFYTYIEIYTNKPEIRNFDYKDVNYQTLNNYFNMTVYTKIPDKIQISIDGFIVYNNIFENAETISTKIDHYSLGYHYVSVMINNTNGNIIWRNFTFYVYTIEPTLENIKLDDYIFSSKGNSVSFRIYSVRPDTFSIFINNELKNYSKYIDGELVEYSIDGLSKGEHTVRITVNNTLSEETGYQKTIRIAEPNILIEIKNLSDFELHDKDKEIEFQLTYTFPAYYSLIIDNKTRLNGKYKSGEVISYSVDRFNEGTHEVEIQANSTDGKKTSYFGDFTIYKNYNVSVIFNKETYIITENSTKEDFEIKFNILQGYSVIQGIKYNVLNSRNITILNDTLLYTSGQRVLLINDTLRSLKSGEYTLILEIETDNGDTIIFKKLISIQLEERLNFIMLTFAAIPLGVVSFSSAKYGKKKYSEITREWDYMPSKELSGIDGKSGYWENEIF